jgi:ABC-2 type transport system permease protein
MSASDLRMVLHAERTKLRTAPGAGWLRLAVVVTTVAVGAASASVTVCTTVACGIDATRVGLTGVQLGQAVVAVLMIGDEYGTGMVRVTLTAMPRRITVLGAKASVLVAVVTAAATPAAGPAILRAGGFRVLTGLWFPGYGTSSWERGAGCRHGNAGRRSPWACSW